MQLIEFVSSWFYVQTYNTDTESIGKFWLLQTNKQNHCVCFPTRNTDDLLFLHKLSRGVTQRVKVMIHIGFWWRKNSKALLHIGTHYHIAGNFHWCKIHRIACQPFRRKLRGESSCFHVFNQSAAPGSPFHRTFKISRFLFSAEANLSVKNVKFVSCENFPLYGT